MLWSTEEKTDTNLDGSRVHWRNNLYTLAHTNNVIMVAQFNMEDCLQVITVITAGASRRIELGFAFFSFFRKLSPCHPCAVDREPSFPDCDFQTTWHSCSTLVPRSSITTD